ncbi:potassium channel family protein [Halovivax limisalsi]|uniref:potassium channel family protein n=1 Tax=Halovivax limisalsi TaxID=1453760 RepID=UPI001FFD56BF|nr:TrkA C-terminal domain-containing protein [Halovivax limisalsi]
MDPYEGEISAGSVEYEPVSVKDLLVEMKDTAELLIDLSFSAILHQHHDLAREVLRLEERMDLLELRARMSLLMAARSPDDAERLAPVLGIVAAADQISDAAGDIAKILLDDIGLPEAMRTTLPEAIESLERVEVAADSSYAGRTLVDVDLESETGVRVIALRRGAGWLLNPGPETAIEPDDVAFLRGTETDLGPVVETLTGEAYELPDPEPPAIADLERAIDTIVHMKNLSELAVDLAYSSVLFDSRNLAEEVRNLEIEVDALQSRFTAWALKAASEAEDPVRIRGLMTLASATEEISDAAIGISEGVFREIDVHPVVQLAVQESDEIITRIVVDPGSDLVGTPIVEGRLETEATMSAIAIRRPDDGWLLIADADAELRAGDVLIAKGTRTAEETIQSLSAA